MAMEKSLNQYLSEDAILMLKDNLNDEEKDLGWIYPVSIFAEGHRVGWWGFICCLLFISNVC